MLYVGGGRARVLSVSSTEVEVSPRPCFGLIKYLLCFAQLKLIVKVGTSPIQHFTAGRN